MTSSLKSGDVALVDLGYLGKVRPCLVFCPDADSQRNVAILAPLTREVRGGESEVTFPKPCWLTDDCVLNLSGLAGVDKAKVIRRLGPFPPDRFVEAKRVLAKMLDLEHPAAEPGT